MAESVGVGGPVAVSEMDIVTLKKALIKQQKLLVQLHAELEKEREASESAASEALSMILRLQGQKAAMNMEASQYKRMAEEKIEHAEESIAIFEELIYQKEMEISSLEFQIESYKYKLLSMGLTEDEFPEDIVSPRIKSTQAKDVGESSVVSKLISLPALALRNSGASAAVEDQERSAVDVVPDDQFESSIPSIGDDEKGKQPIHKDKSMELGNSRGSVYGDLNSYWEQIQELDERIKEISSFDVGGSKQVVASHDEEERVVSTTEFSHTKDHPKPDSPCNSVMDIFEVPVSEIDDNIPSPAKGKGKMIREEEEEDDDEDEDEDEEVNCDEGDRVKNPDLLVLEKKTLYDDATIWEDDNEGRFVKKKLLRSEYNRPRGDMETKPKVCAENSKPMSKSPKHQKMESDLQLVRATTEMAACRVEMQQLTERIKQLEVARMTTRDEIDEARDEEKCILNEIREQLQFIQTEVTNLRPKKSPTSDDFSLVPLTEGMLYFWL